MKSPLALAFTLVELLVTIAVMGIALAIAVPSFKDTLRNNYLTATINEFIVTLNYARNEAIRRSMQVSVAKTGTNWENGWQVFTDSANSNNKYGTVEGTDEVLRVHGPLSANYILRANNPFANYISFKPSGVSNTFGSFALCDYSNSSQAPTKNTARLIIVDLLGRVTFATDSNNDGILVKPGTTPTNFTDCTSP